MPVEVKLDQLEGGVSSVRQAALFPCNFGVTYMKKELFLSPKGNNKTQMIPEGQKKNEPSSLNDTK